MINLVGSAFFNDLCIAGNNRNIGGASGFSNAFDDLFERLKFKAFLDDKPKAQGKRPCAGDGQIVDRAADGEFADIAAIEKTTALQHSCRS